MLAAKGAEELWDPSMLGRSVYGSRLVIKLVVWVTVTCICCLIIASRHHYTGGRVVAAVLRAYQCTSTVQLMH